MAKMALIDYLKKYAVKMVDLRQDIQDLPKKKHPAKKVLKSKQQAIHR